MNLKKLKQALNNHGIISWDTPVTDETAGFLLANCSPEVRERIEVQMEDDSLSGKVITGLDTPQKPSVRMEPADKPMPKRHTLSLETVLTLLDAFHIPEYCGSGTFRQGISVYRCIVKLTEVANKPNQEVGLWKTTPQYTRGCFRSIPVELDIEQITFPNFCRMWDIIDNRELTDLEEGVSIFVYGDQKIFNAIYTQALTALCVSVGAISKLKLEEETDEAHNRSEASG